MSVLFSLLYGPTPHTLKHDGSPRTRRRTPASHLSGAATQKSLRAEKTQIVILDVCVFTQMSRGATRLFQAGGALIAGGHRAKNCQREKYVEGELSGGGDNNGGKEGGK